MSIRMAAAFGAVMLAVAFSAGPALAHDGHDHGAAPPPVSKSIAPRGEAVSDAFELTAIPKDGKITFYLDRFRTNEPIRGATLEVETPDAAEGRVPDRGCRLLAARAVARQARIARPPGHGHGPETSSTSSPWP